MEFEIQMEHLNSHTASKIWSPSSAGISAQSKQAESKLEGIEHAQSYAVRRGRSAGINNQNHLLINCAWAPHSARTVHAKRINADGTRAGCRWGLRVRVVSTKEINPGTTMDDRAHKRNICVTYEFQIQRTIPITKLICCVFNALLNIL